MIKDFNQVTKSTWNFSEPGHGKGPMDGVGGYLKRTADRYVHMGNDVKTATDFVDLFKDSAINVKVIPEEDVTNEKNNVPSTLDAILGIMNITKISWLKQSEVIIKLYQYEHFQKELKLPTISRLLNISSIESEDVSMSVIESPFVEEPIEDVWKDYVNLKDRPSIYKTVYNSSSSDDEDLMTISVRQQKDTSNVDASTSYGKESVHINLISPGTYLLIKVPTQKANIYYRYVATCQSGVDHDDGEILVTFLRSVRNNTRKFKLEVKDVSYINFDQIISIIPTPVLKKEHNREYYYFDRDIDVYEKN